MYSVLFVKGLLWFLTLIGCISSNPIKFSNDTSIVKCSMIHNSSACFIESSDLHPVNKTGGIPTMQPKIENIEFYIVEKKHMNRIYLKVEWSQKTIYIKKYVTGYFIRIDVDRGNDVVSGLKVNLDFEKLPMLSKKIHFVFDEYGELFEHLIYTNIRYQVTLKALPIFDVKDHHEWDPHQSVWNITSPKCPTKVQSKKFWPGCIPRENKDLNHLFEEYYDTKDYDTIFEEEKGPDFVDEDYPDTESFDYTREMRASYNNTTALIVVGIMLVTVSVIAVNAYIKRDFIKSSIASACCRFEQNTESGSQKQLLEDGSEQIIVVTCPDDREDKRVHFTQYLASSMAAQVTAHSQEVQVDCNLWALNTSKDTKLWLCDAIEKRNSDSVSLLLIGADDEKLLEYRNVARKCCDVTKIRSCRRVVFAGKAPKRSFKMSRSDKCYELPRDLEEMLDNLAMMSLSSKVTLQLKKLAQEIIDSREASKC